MKPKGILDGFILNAPALDDRRIAYLEAEGVRGSIAPPLTATRAPFTDACVPLAELLLAAIAGRTPPDQLQQVAQPALAVRASTAPPAPGDDFAW